MKMNYWLMIGLLVAVNATAQNSTNNLPAMPAPMVGTGAAEPAPAVAEPPAATPSKKKVAAKKKTAKPAAKKSTLTEPTVTLVAGPAEVSVSHLNVRGQAGLKGEVITHVVKGDTVTVLNEITLDKHKADEPAQWAKISLPSSISVWVSSHYLDSTNKTVTPKKLNLRAGPGENYSVLGVVERGTTVVETGSKDGWTKIEAPASAYAFVAAMYLKQESSGNLATNTEPSTETETVPATPTTVEEPPTIAAEPPTTAPVTAPAEPARPVVPVTEPSVVIPTNIVAEADTNLPPPPPRVVTHEGWVRHSVSIVAPTYYELYDPATDVAINYLYSNTTNLDLSRYDGTKINVTGEEGLDARWLKTPVLTVQKIYVLEKPVPVVAPKSKFGGADGKHP